MRIILGHRNPARVQALAALLHKELECEVSYTTSYPQILAWLINGGILVLDEELLGRESSLSFFARLPKHLRTAPSELFVLSLDPYACANTDGGARVFDSTYGIPALVAQLRRCLPAQP